MTNEQFARKTRRNGECLEWTGARNSQGYGHLRNINGKHVLAHRHSFLINKGDIPNGLLVMHKCDNRICVNPAHLSVGTSKDNVQDAISKGRMKMGKNNKLTVEQAIQIASRYQRFSHTQNGSATLAKEFGVSADTIRFTAQTISQRLLRAGKVPRSPARAHCLTFGSVR